MTMAVARTQTQAQTPTQAQMQAQAPAQAQGGGDGGGGSDDGGGGSGDDYGGGGEFYINAEGCIARIDSELAGLVLGERRCKIQIADTSKEQADPEEVGSTQRSSVENPEGQLNLTGTFPWDEG